MKSIIELHSRLFDCLVNIAINDRRVTQDLNDTKEWAKRNGYDPNDVDKLYEEIYENTDCFGYHLSRSEQNDSGH